MKNKALVIGGVAAAAIISTLSIVLFAFSLESEVSPPLASSSSFPTSRRQLLMQLGLFSDPKSVQLRGIDNVASTADGPHSNCHYGDAIGHFSQTFSQRSNPNANWVWVSDESNCPFEDYVQLLTQRQVRNDAQPINFVFIGDSLDRHLVQKLCSLLPSATFPLTDDLDANDKLANRGILREKAVVLCKSGALTVAHFKIFGMKKPCDNGGLMARTDSRQQSITEQRIKQYLPHDVLTHMIGGHLIAMVGSCLWDLSIDCTMSNSVDPGFLDDYADGILQNHRALKKLGVNQVYWRTCPPLTTAYSDENMNNNLGRTRENQNILNQLLMEVVRDKQLGRIVDWSQMMTGGGVPESSIDMKDGVHYESGPSIAFLNMFFNALFYAHEELKAPILGDGDDVIAPYLLEFVHITKTGGTSIEAAAAKSGIVWGACKFKGPRDQCAGLDRFSDFQQRRRYRSDWRCRAHEIEPWHCPPAQFAHGGNLYHGSDTFAVIRHPYDRLISEFFYLRDVTYRSRYWVSDSSGNEVLQPEYDSPEFLNSWVFDALDKVDNTGCCQSGHCVPMHKYTHDRNGKQIVNHILRMENLSVEFPQLMQLYGMPVGNLNHDNSRGGNGGSDPNKLGVLDLTADVLRRVNEYAKLDFEYFGYSMIIP